jgi:DNA-binding response OmpR family regulator
MALRRKKPEVWDGVERRAPACVLIVNDDDGARELLTRIVRNAGYRTSSAATHEEAMAALVDLLPRCIVLDIRSGGIGSNLKLLDIIRSKDDVRMSSARAVIIADSPKNRAFSFQSGTDAFVIRPYRAEELLEQIADVLKRPDVDRARHRRDELARHGELVGDVVPGSRPVWERPPFT